MKKNIIFAAALAALVSLGACSGGKCDSKAKGDCTKKECCKKADKTYTGVLPAADAYGVRYTLTLDFDDEKNGGDYDLVQTYFNVDSTGIVDVASFVSEGDFTTGKTAAGTDYINLGKGAEAMYFVVEGDSAIVMTDATYTPAATPGMNYTLKAAKK